MSRILTPLLVLILGQQIIAQTSVVRVPNSGIQPQAEVDADGTLHLIYFKGEPANGDLFYVNRVSGTEVFSQPVRVNQKPESAVAMGTIRGAQLALGKNDRVHVAWMGSGKTAQKGSGKHPEHPMFYTRLDESGTAFEPERNVMMWTGGLDGGGSVAADSLGNVFVAWHGSPPNNSDGETGRAMYVAVSRDDGATFRREDRANPEPTGSCGCCGMRAFMDENDHLHLLYRAANKLSRDMTLLTSVDHGRAFSSQTVNRWFIQSCPMSSAVMADHPRGLLIATEVEGLLELSRVDALGKPPGKLSTLSPAKAKHASVATNQRGEILVAWAQNAGWAKGGELKWRLFDADGIPKSGEKSGAELTTWSYPVVVTVGDEFVILY